VGLRKLRGAEAVLRAAFPRGTWLDLRTGDADRDDPAWGQSWGRGRTLRAEAITALLLGDFDPVPGCADPDRSLP